MNRVLVVCLVAFGAGPLSHAQSKGPNIVVMLADDMGYGDPGCFNGKSRIKTPHIDRLAAEGMRFTDAHAPGAYCIPSRYGLLTGRYPLRNRFNVARQAAIGEDQVTLASLLRSRGYRTGMVGKWHLGFDRGPDFDWSEPMKGGPLDVGFDEYFGIPASLDIPPYYYIRGRRPVAPPTETIAARNTRGWTDIQGEFWRAGRIAKGFVHSEVLPVFEREAVAFIQRRARDEVRRPFFLYVAFASPHTPWLPTGEFKDKSPIPLYGDFVTETDAAVGNILKALKEGGFDDDTLVIFTSDNGPVWYPADVQKYGHRSVGPFRGMKSDCWEGGHRMPFVARWKGRVSVGARCDQTVCFTDLLATFAEVTGRPLESGKAGDSVSMVPLLTGGSDPIRDVTVLRLRASVVRQGKWKLIDHLGSGGFSKPRRVRPRNGGPKGQLYDLEADPGETTNLWLEEPEVVARLTAILDAHKAARPR